MFINLTPHAIVFRTESGEDVTFAGSGSVARVATRELPTKIAGMPAIIREFGEVVVPADDVGFCSDSPRWLIVSSLVLEAARATGHHLLAYMVAPDTGPTAIRNTAGHVVAVTRWVVAR